MTKAGLYLYLQLIDVVYMRRKADFSLYNNLLQDLEDYIVKKDASSFSSRGFSLRYAKTIGM